jgi:hypothetical protein
LARHNRFAFVSEPTFVYHCSGSETIGHMPPGFLVNDRVMLDAGTISAALGIEGQSRITDIFISHTHLDHIKGLLFLADNVIGRIKRPVNIRAIPTVIDAIKKHLMNDLIWPDFTKIPTPKDPVLAYKPFPAGKFINLAAGLKLMFPYEDLEMRGHCIECRINAEDPITYVPSPGKIDFLVLPGGEGIRVDSAAYGGWQIPRDYDSLVAKIIAFAPTRPITIKKMLAALEMTTIVGIKTNLPLHLSILSNSDFIN